MIPVPAESSAALVPPEWAGERLDRAVTALLGQGLSRSCLARWIRQGRVSLDGSPVLRPGWRVESGQKLVLCPPVGEPLPPGMEEPRILFQDEGLVVLEKPAGLPMHGNYRGDPQASLARFLAERFGPDLPTNQGTERPGIVHRLDRGTSGVCVAALEQGVFLDLQEQFKERSIKKEYLALVQGRPRFQGDWIDRRLVRDARQPGRMRTTRSSGPGTRDASTWWEVRERFRGFALLLVRPRTGRMHQIRVHLTSIHLPVVGDALYRDRRHGSNSLPKEAPPIGRPLLHALSLTFEHPARGETMTFHSDPPADFRELVLWLEQNAPDPGEPVK